MENSLALPQPKQNSQVMQQSLPWKHTSKHLHKIFITHNSQECENKPNAHQMMTI